MIHYLCDDHLKVPGVKPGRLVVGRDDIPCCMCVQSTPAAMKTHATHLAHFKGETLCPGGRKP